MECPAQPQAEKFIPTLTAWDLLSSRAVCLSLHTSVIVPLSRGPLASLAERVAGTERCSHFCQTNPKKTSISESDKGKALRDDQKDMFQEIGFYFC